MVRKKHTCKKHEISKKLGENYFENGWLDSLKFIELINDVEQEFEILFSNDEFQNRKFATINGLKEIITGKK